MFGRDSQVLYQGWDRRSTKVISALSSQLNRLEAVQALNKGYQFCENLFSSLPIAPRPASDKYKAQACLVHWPSMRMSSRIRMESALLFGCSLSPRNAIPFWFYSPPNCHSNWSWARSPTRAATSGPTTTLPELLPPFNSMVPPV